MEVDIVDNTVVLTTASGEQTIIQSANIVLDGAIKGARYNSAPQAISSNPIDGTQLTQAVRYKIILPLVNKDEEYFYLDEVTNQATWTNDLAGANQAVEDIAASFPTSGGGGGGVTSVSATTPLSSTGGATPNIALSPYLTYNEQSDTTYTLSLTDAAINAKVSLTDADAIAVLIPKHADVPFPVGAIVSMRQGGAGAVTTAGDTGVTVNAPGGFLTSIGKGAQWVAEQVAVDEWDVYGMLEA